MAVLKTIGTSQVVQWLRLHASPAEAAGLIPGQETKISQAVRPKEKKKLTTLQHCCWYEDEREL